MITKINVQYDPILKEIAEYAKAATSYSRSGAILEMLKRGLRMDILTVGGRWSSDKSEHKAARKAERAERQERKAAEPKPKEQPKDDEWTHSEWMAELRRLYMAKADTLEGDEQKAFCEASLPRFKVEKDARRLYEELKADDW